jgi:hypothetical protein
MPHCRPDAASYTLLELEFHFVDMENGLSKPDA